MRADVGRAEPDTERDTRRDTGTSLDWEVAPDDGGMWNVIIHNDDVTPIDYVMAVLRAVFHLSGADATRITLRAHLTGTAYVMTLPYEEAKYRVGQAHSLARSAGYPLTFSIEPET